MFTYNTKNGKTVLSPRNLSYACTTSNPNVIVLEKLTPEDDRDISLFGDPGLAHIIKLAVDGGDFETPETAMVKQNGDVEDLDPSKNFAITHNNTTYILNGTYQPIGEFLKKAGRKELQVAVGNLATQMALQNFEIASRKVRSGA